MGSPDQNSHLVLGARAKQRREDLEFTVQQLAKKAGVSKNTIVRFEKGEGSNYSTIQKICAALDCTHDELVGKRKYRAGKDYLVWDRDLYEKKENEDPREKAPTNFEKATTVGRNQIIEQGLTINASLSRLPQGMINATVLEIVQEGKPRSHPGEELLFCLTGTVGIRLGLKHDNPKDDHFTELVLEKGDGVLFWGIEPHSYFNPRYDPAKEDQEIGVALSVWLDPDADPKAIDQLIYFTEPSTSNEEDG